jgi:hypothetical protein
MDVNGGFLSLANFETLLPCWHLSACCSGERSWEVSNNTQRKLMPSSGPLTAEEPSTTLGTLPKAYAESWKSRSRMSRSMWSALSVSSWRQVLTDQTRSLVSRHTHSITDWDPSRATMEGVRGPMSRAGAQPRRPGAQDLADLELRIISNHKGLRGRLTAVRSVTATVPVVCHPLGLK